LGAQDITLTLPQSGSDAVLILTMRRGGDGAWRLAMPTETDLAAARKALLVRSQGHAPAADAFRRLHSPRDTMRAFLAGMSNWDTGGRDLALSTLDLRNVPEIIQQREGIRAARYLRRALEHIGMTGLQSIPDDGTGREPYVHFVDSVGAIVIAPSGPEADAAWRFTPQTIATIDNLFLATEALPPPVAAPPGRIPRFGFFQIRAFIGTLAPALLGRAGHFEYWQLLAYPMLIALMFGIAHGITRAICFGILLVLRPVRRVPAAFVWSVKILLLFGLLLPMADLMSLPVNTLAYTAPFSRALACLLGSVAAWHLLRMIRQHAAALTELRATYTDEIPLTLVLTAAQFVVVIVGTVGMAYFLSIPAANIVAGIGIGGLAVAFASRETLSNIFGAGILISDRPFRQGDWIKSGDIEGAIEQVGIWSTRVRTTKGSVIVVPNGKLTESTIDNMGQRRHRLVETRLVVAAGATPEKLEAFTEALRRRIADDPILVTDRTMINVSDFSEFGVVISLIIYLDVADEVAEGRARHTLMLDILRLAQQEGLRLGAEVPQLAIAQSLLPRAPGPPPSPVL
jgi:small-conductance mechanosensitive channel